jgi:internalin A
MRIDHQDMKKFFLLASLSLFISQTLPTIALAKQPTKSESFIQLCQRRKSLPRATKHTIDAMLFRIRTKNCQKANDTITSMGSLTLRDSGITDLTPIASFPKLKMLSLPGNKINDLRPLSNLTQLISLNLTNNKIIDINPLNKLTKLDSLYLMNNQLSDIRPLANLTKLQFLDLRENNISDVRSLANLKDFRRLEMRGNKVTAKDCPFISEKMCAEVYNVDKSKE